jgi:hydroxyethylthiazole kinase
MKEKIKKLLDGVRGKKPLVHQITNYVSVNDCANITLAIGASPIMADDAGEVEEITSISDALVINIGTLNTRTIDSMILAGKTANAKNIPVILDPVGAGASGLRNRTTLELLEKIKFAVIRGNASEMGYILGVSNSTKGVDVSEGDKDLDKIEIAKQIATKYNCISVITGATDVITDGKEVVLCENGSPSMASITGTGCMLTALIGSFCGVGSDYFTSAVSGVICMGIAGEIYNKDMRNVGIINAIDKMNDDTIEKYAKIRTQ